MSSFNSIFLEYFALLAGLFFPGVSGFAQLTIPPWLYQQPDPPSGAYEWSGGAGNADWEDPDNWVGGDAPPHDEADLLSGNAAQGTGPITVDFADSYPWQNSLWFEGGRDITLLADDSASISLGYGLSSGDHLIGFFTGKPTASSGWPFADFSAVHHSQVNIEAGIEVWLADDRLWEESYDFIIENGTRGGLRFGGRFNLGALGSGDNIIGS